MRYHANARTNVQQRQRIRQSRDPYRVQARQLGVSGATIAKWTQRPVPQDASRRPRRIHKALPPELEPVLAALRQEWLLDLDAVWQALRQSLFPQLSRSAVYRELVRLQLQRVAALRPQARRARGRFRACPPGFLPLNVFYLPRLDGRRRYLFLAIDRATRLLTVQVYAAHNAASGVAFLVHCQRFSPFRVYRILTDNGREFTLRGYRARGTTTKVHAFTQACRRARIRHSLTKPRHPWTNGLAERVGSTFKTETVHRFHFDGVAQLLQRRMPSNATSTSIARTKPWAAKRRFSSCTIGMPNNRNGFSGNLCSRSQRGDTRQLIDKVVNRYSLIEGDSLRLTFNE